jgi:hypothetical protein
LFDLKLSAVRCLGECDFPHLTLDNRGYLEPLHLEQLVGV